jgi:hypothetical protein
LSIVATAFLITTGCASAVEIDILRVNDPSAPFSLLDLGAGTQNALQTNSGFALSGMTFSFGGGSPASGEYAGNLSGLAASPFGALDAARNYLVAGGDGGTVDVTWIIPQSELLLLWGTVDIEVGRNVISIGGETITGADVAAAIGAEGLSFTNGATSAFLRITNLSDFTSATFSNSGGPAFEFSVGAPEARAVPGPIVGAGLPGLILAAGALLALGRRRRRSLVN